MLKVREENVLVVRIVVAIQTTEFLLHGRIDAVVISILVAELNVDGELIKGCHCRFHPFRHELEITNPATGRVIVTTYEYYSIERRYFKRRKKEEEE